MPRNGSGVYSAPANTKGVPNATIESTRYNSFVDDIAATFTGSIAADGQTPMTGDLAMGGNKVTGLDGASAAADAPTAGQVQSGTFVWGGTAGGTADALTISVTPGIGAYAAGQAFRFAVGASPNTGAATLNVNGLGAKAITKRGAAALLAGDLPANAVAEVGYDGTQFQLLGAGPNVSAFGATLIDDASAAAARTTLDAQEDVVTARGDVVRGSAAGAAERLALGASGQYLRSNGTDAAWSAIQAADVPAVTPANGSVSQSKLKTTMGEVSAFLSGGATSLLTLPGGQYGFYPQVKTSAGGSMNAHIVNGAPGTSYVTQILLGLNAGNQTVFARQRYVQASPPYDLGDGKVLGFFFALVDRDGVPRAMYIADEPPWVYNGPTDCRPDFWDERGVAHKRLLLPDVDLDAYLAGEIPPGKLRAVKLAEADVPVGALAHADMDAIPHPFAGHDAGLTPVLLDPMDKAVRELARMQFFGADLGALFAAGKYRIDNEPLARAGPRDVMQVRVKQ